MIEDETNGDNTRNAAMAGDEEKQVTANSEGNVKGGDSSGEEELSDHSQNEPDSDHDDDDSSNEDEEDPHWNKEAAPCYTKANKLKFFPLCNRLENLWRLRREKPKRPPSLPEKLQSILPPKLLASIEPESVFPLMRLLMPEKDSSRHTLMKEKTIAKAYCDALGFLKDHRAHKQLHNFTDPNIVSAGTAGDFSLVLQEVLSQRLPNKPSTLDVGEINALLDDLSNITKKNHNRSNHDWRRQSQQQAEVLPKKKGPNLRQLRSSWITKVIGKALSPLEHKWLVRIVMERLQYGIGFETVLKWYNPYAMEVWTAHNSLKTVCNRLCNPLISKQRRELAHQHAHRIKEERFSEFYVPPSSDPLCVGRILSPMLATRTSFEGFMTHIHDKHKNVIKLLPKEDPVRNHSLALKFPTFTVEVKMDGERMIVHIQRGIVTMHTRRARWYSDIYSPCLGPALRRAIQKYNLDLILDGEVVAWDNGRKELVPFGQNRTIAILRRKYMMKHNMLDERDFGLHQEEEDVTVMRFADVQRFQNIADHEQLAGAECWLKFVAFDLLYMDGPDAKTILQTTLPHCTNIVPGTATSLTGHERKLLLYKVLDIQENEVEIVPTTVIRSNGKSARGEDYFSPTHPTMECGQLAHMIDSIKYTLGGDIPSFMDLDSQRRNDRSDIRIHQARALAVDEIYDELVEKQRLEGLIFKDLAAPYVLGRSRQWFKLKPDYSQDATLASDLDLVVIGGSFATGLRRSGQLSSFLCACVDSQESERFFTVCRINGNSTNADKLAAVMAYTGFQKATAEKDVEYGKWFRESQHGKSLPDFLTMRSFQVGQREKGWRFDVIKNYPDLWIHPQDSVIMTVNAGEIVASDEYSAGLTLRFPRIQRVRLGEGEKPVSEIESEESLYHLFQSVQQQRSSSDGGVSFSATSPTKLQKNEYICRFKTVEQYSRQSKIKRRRAKLAVAGAFGAAVDTTESDALAELSFTVLEGIYSLTQDSAEAEDARDEGWLEEAIQVKNSDAVRQFIRQHGGTVRVSPDDHTIVLGGRSNDPRVMVYLQALGKLRTTFEETDSDTPGVLKWTWVYSVVYRWLQKRNESKASSSTKQNLKDDFDAEKYDFVCIKSTFPQMLQPRFFDFLVRVSDNKQFLDSILNLEKLENSGVMRRALNEIGLRKADPEVQAVPPLKRPRTDEQYGLSETKLPWQYAGIFSLKEKDRWILSTRQQSLWPYKGNTGKDCQSTIILYPDLFRNEFGFVSMDEALQELKNGTQTDRLAQVHPDASLSKIAASLPLLRAMGVLVTYHLHSGVTHILCDLKGVNTSTWSPGENLTGIFPNELEMDRLLHRLEQVKRSVKDPEVSLVSPAWVLSNWK